MTPYTVAERQAYEIWAYEALQIREGILAQKCPKVTDLCGKVEAGMVKHLGLCSYTGCDAFRMLLKARDRCLDFQNYLREIPDEEAVEIKQVLAFVEGI